MTVQVSDATTRSQTGITTQGQGRRAADRATRHNSSAELDLPLLGKVQLPSGKQLGYYGGLAFLAAVEVIEWPVAVALGAGHLFMQNHNNKVLKDFGEALEEA